MSNKKNPSQFAVIGLGRFGLSIVQTLAEHDVSILACDKNTARLHQAADFATHLVQIDVTDEQAMEKLGLGNFDVVVLAIGEDFEASQMAAMVAKEQGAAFVLVKARNHRQKKILESIGIDRVVLPEFEMGAKTARKLLDSSLADLLEESEQYSIKEIRPLDSWIGRSIREADIQKVHGTIILGVRQGDTLDIPVSPDRILKRDDVLIVFKEERRST